MSLNTLTVLRAARERITDPGDWQQKSAGSQFGPNCMVGAVGWTANLYVQDDDIKWAAISILDTLAKQKGYRTAWQYNDSHTHEQVLAFMDEAIRREESKMGLPGKSKTITVEPLKTAPPSPKETPAPTPVKVPEKVPA
jgi:hypothetical protein